MHEAGVVRDVLKRATEAAAEDGSELVSIRVEIGDLSGVDPNFFRDQIGLLAPALDLVVEDGDGDGVSLVSVTVR